MAREVEEAFADVAYSGDDKLLDGPAYYPREYLLATFQGKHWRDIRPEMLREHEHHLMYFSPEAFRFYLPCFLIPILLRCNALDHLWDTVFYNLAPGHTDPDFLKELVNLLDARQKAIILRYVELYVQTEGTDRDPRNQESVAFWQRITDPATDA